MAYLLVAALVFGVCFGLDKGFTKLFRGQKQHRSGRAVRQQKKNALFGIFLFVLGVLGITVGVTQSLGLAIGSALVLLMGLALTVWYISYGIFYDEDSFLWSAFGRKSVAHRFGEIRTQKLYRVQGGRILVELYMADGSAVSVDCSMEGAFDFLDFSFHRWCEQTGRNPESCEFHDPANCLWFPGEEDA